MIVYRLTQSKYKDDLEGTGAFLYGGRWNSVKQNMLYTASSISLAVLELVVHILPEQYSMPYHLLHIALPDEKKHYNIIDAKALPSNWKENTDITKWIGDEFLKHPNLLYLKVPSCIIEEEQNILINPMAKEINKMKIINSTAYSLDNRLLKK